jgi:hypothetical protein
MNDVTCAGEGRFPSTADQDSEASTAAREAFFRKLSEQLAYGHPYGPWQAG